LQPGADYVLDFEHRDGIHIHPTCQFKWIQTEFERITVRAAIGKCFRSTDCTRCTSEELSSIINLIDDFNDFAVIN
jgi:hypothetical protein